MLTQAENQAARAQAADFLTEATAYKALLAAHKLPLSVDLHQLTDVYRGRLFEQLLAADAGLKARYDMVRTPAGQKQFRTETMATIDLRGHELPKQLQEALNDLEQAYHVVPMPNEVKRLALSLLASGYGLDLGRYLDERTESWAGKEPALAYFEQLGAALTQWRTVVNSFRGNPSNLSDLLSTLDYFFPSMLPEQGPVKVDAKRLYLQLHHNPQLLELLATLPGRQAA
jgi:hypothetical protein